MRWTQCYKPKASSLTGHIQLVYITLLCELTLWSFILTAQLQTWTWKSVTITCGQLSWLMDCPASKKMSSASSTLYKCCVVGQKQAPSSCCKQEVDRLRGTFPHMYVHFECSETLNCDWEMKRCLKKKTLHGADTFSDHEGKWRLTFIPWKLWFQFHYITNTDLTVCLLKGQHRPEHISHSGWIIDKQSSPTGLQVRAAAFSSSFSASGVLHVWGPVGLWSRHKAWC